ncbi:copper homeostasis periplasmic binding protein CopC [Musicola paradisiaca]|uniref:Copper resistance protein C n=1 Tax=Musicola paradisiaca (strain Ech703) TaxID=579405 RepID=C6CD01_MUSP7|nr:copper homeostasis periplasmic binding protein CopC [Musicola paradisiaca]ACS85042.1 copper resistance protein CopC [Musicola paradisiaca Ech703]
MTNSLKHLTLAASLVMALLPVSQAYAHAHLKSAEPADKSEVAVAPGQLTLTFTEGVEAAFSGVELKDAAGSPVKTGKAVVDAADKTRLVAPLAAPLSAGKYSVDWHVLSVDGHKSQGKYSFSVK